MHRPPHTRAHTHIRTHTHTRRRGQHSTRAGEDNTEDNTTRTPIRSRTDFKSDRSQSQGTAVHGSDQHFGLAFVRRLTW